MKSKRSLKPNFKLAFKPRLNLNLNIKPSTGMLVISLGVVALVAALLSHGLLYWVALGSARENVEQSAKIAAENTASNIANFIALLNQNLNGQANDPRLAAALSQANPAAIEVEEERLTRTIPYAWLARLLPENIQVLDESRTPHMGYADLSMVKDALSAIPQPAFHLLHSPDAHLAMARRLASGGGVILVSWPTKILNSAISEKGVCGIELRQESTSLAYLGAPNCKDKEPTGENAINGTPWKISYWANAEVNTNIEWFGGALATSLVLIFGCTGFLVYWLNFGFRLDKQNLLALVNDLYSGSFLGNYPFKLAESAALADELSRIKRVQHDSMSDFSAPSLPRSSLNLTEFNSEENIFTAGLSLPVESDIDRIDSPGSEMGFHAPPRLDNKLASVSTGMFRGGDIRAVAGENLREDTIYAIGLAIGSEMDSRGEKHLVVAYDGRLSCPELFGPLTQGLLDTGRTVVNLGLAPTPLLYYATHTLDIHSGVMLTGGSNPPEYNGLKIVIAGEALSEAGIQSLGQRIDLNDFVSGTGGMRKHLLIPDYIERVVGDIQLGRNLRIAMDCGNGVASLVAPELVRNMGCEVIELFSEVDGHFPNHDPDPTQPPNLQALIDKVRDTQADLGVAFDGDGNRLGVVDSSGKIIWPDRLMMLFAADVLSLEPGADIIYDVRCSRSLPSQIVKNGGRPLLSKSGHAHIKAKIKESGAILAGEMDGHIYFQDRWFGFDDAIYACARLIEILSNRDENSAEVFAGLPDSINTPELRVFVEEGENTEIVEQFLTIGDFSDARVTDIDGLRVDFLDGWGLIRASNILPALMFRFEADNEEALTRIQQRFADVLHQIKPELELPFKGTPIRLSLL